MTDKTEYDQIDEELSKIYFNSTVIPKTKKDETDTSAAIHRKEYIASSPSSPKKRTGRSLSRRFVIGLTALCTIAIASGAIYYCREKILLFTVIETDGNQTRENNIFRIGKADDSDTAHSLIDTFHGKIVQTLFSFEKSKQGWENPSWTLAKSDYVLRDLSIASHPSTEGKKSLELIADFPGRKWSCAYAEIFHDLDLDEYETIAADIFIPAAAPEGLKAKFILTVSDNWRYTEMARAVQLIPGKWITLTGDISSESFDWKRTKVDNTFKQDIRKMGIRIEYSKPPPYSGAIYVDNVRVVKDQF